MTSTIEQIMTPNPLTATSDTKIVDAARLMRDGDVGDVIVVDGAQVRGIVTDRDITVRAVAEGVDVTSVSVGDICTGGLWTVSPKDTVETAVDLMREHSVRRLPVVEGDRPVGIISLGDLAIERDPASALAEISAAPANN